MKRALVLCSLIATYAAFGRGAVEAAGDPRATQLTYQRWNKTCFNGMADCWVGAGARGTCYPSGGGVAIRVMDDKSASLFATLGTKRTLEGAITVQIDQDDPISIPHPECHTLGCGGRFDIDSVFIARLKGGQTITVKAINTAHQKLSLSLSLSDFAKAYDGPGKEHKVIEQTLTKE